MPGNPFLSQISPLTTRSNGGITCPMTSSPHFATIATHSFASGNSAFTSAVPMNAAHLQQVGIPQSTLELQQVITQEGATGIGIAPPKMMTLPVVKPSAAKIGRKDALTFMCTDTHACTNVHILWQFSFKLNSCIHILRRPRYI